MHALLPNAPPTPPPSAVRLVGDGRRATNAAAVLRSILDHGPVARSTVARHTGLSAAAVSRQYTALADLGLVHELAWRAPRSSIGRPHIPVDIDVAGHVVGGVHIALAHSTITVVDLRGGVLAEQIVPHPSADPREILDGVAGRLTALLARYTGRTTLALGLATGGWVDPDTGVVVSHSQLGWRDVPAAGLLADRLGLPVLVDNHSRALARAEQLFGHTRARARQSLVHLFVGNVVDAALGTAGAVHHGPRSGAGDVAHLPIGDGSVRCPCGRAGCFQAAVSDLAMGERAATAGIVADPSFDGLVLAARDRNPAAVELFRLRARLVGRAVAMLLDVINPEILVVCEGGLALLPDLAPQLLADLHTEVAERSHVCASPETTVVASSFAPHILSVAGASIALDAVYSHPLDLPSRTA